MTDETLAIVSTNGNGAALSAYQTRDDVRELGDRLMAMHPAAGELGPQAMRAAAQLALLLGANPLPGVNEVHVWKDKHGRTCISLGINYWRRKAQEWGGILFEMAPRPMRQNEAKEWGVPDGVTAAIAKGCRAEDMIKYKHLGFTTAEIWAMCGRVGIGTMGTNEYAKSGRPPIWTALKRAETDLLRQLFPAEFGQVSNRMLEADDAEALIEIAPPSPEDVIDGAVVEASEAELEPADSDDDGPDKAPYTLDDANRDLFGAPF